MARICWDTMLFVYWLEDHPEYAGRVEEVWSRMQSRRDSLCSSVFTVGELLVGPYRRGPHELAEKIREFLRPPTVELLPFTSEVADRYARIRAENRVSPADAIQLACAAHAGVQLFLTNDENLKRLVIPGIDFIVGLEVKLF